MNNSRVAVSFASVALAAVGFANITGVAAAEPSQPPYTLQKVSFPTDPRFTQLLGINDHNTIAGYHGDENTENTPNKGFTLRLPTSFTDENFPMSMQTQVIGINNDETTVGFYIDQAGQTHGFEKPRDKGVVSVDLPGTTFNQLLGVNNNDQAAGYFQDAAGLQHAYVHEHNGNFLVLNLPMPSSQATGINDRGSVVGFEQSGPNANTSVGYILKNGKLTELKAFGSTFTQALGVNENDEVVGSYNDANGATHGFIWRNGNFENIDVQGAQSTVVNGVNRDGRIVGFFMDQAGNTVGLIGDRARRDSDRDDRG